MLYRKNVGILITWLLHYPADLNLQVFSSIEYISGFILFAKEFIFSLSTARTELSYLFFGASKIIYGPVNYGYLLVP